MWGLAVDLPDPHKVTAALRSSLKTCLCYITLNQKKIKNGSELTEREMCKMTQIRK